MELLGSPYARSVAFGYHAREACKGTIVRVLWRVKGRSVAQVPDRYCRNCGHELQTEDRFCANCRNPVPTNVTVPTPEAEVLPPPQAENRSMKEWFKRLGRAYGSGPVIALAIVGFLALLGASFTAGLAEGLVQAILVNAGTALVLIPPIVVTERLVVSEEVEEVRTSLEMQLEELRETATEHEYVRENLPPSADRTRRFEQIFDKVKKQAEDANISAEKASDLFKLPFGDRLAVLAYAQIKEEPELFPQVLEAIEHSITAFEQAKALEAAEKILSKLKDKEKQQLKDAINENPWISKIIMDTSYRWDVSQSILKQLDH